MLRRYTHAIALNSTMVNQRGWRRGGRRHLELLDPVGSSGSAQVTEIAAVALLCTIRPAHAAVANLAMDHKYMTHQYLAYNGHILTCVGHL
jgi:hypothetical protein